jgi:hypothetical protein
MLHFCGDDKLDNHMRLTNERYNVHLRSACILAKRALSCLRILLCKTSGHIFGNGWNVANTPCKIQHDMCITTSHIRLQHLHGRLRCPVLDPLRPSVRTWSVNVNVVASRQFVIKAEKYVPLVKTDFCNNKHTLSESSFRQV